MRCYACCRVWTACSSALLPLPMLPQSVQRIRNVTMKTPCAVKRRDHNHADAAPRALTPFFLQRWGCRRDDVVVGGVRGVFLREGGKARQGRARQSMAQRHSSASHTTLQCRIHCVCARITLRCALPCTVAASIGVQCAARASHRAQTELGSGVCT